MKGVRTTGASKILENNVADADAFIVQRLRRNGAVIVGKANLHEFCFGPTSQSTLRPRAQSLGRGWHRWRIQRRIGGGSGIGHVHGIHRK
jgi:aspartyl-tRNA(Asn)/glutamyl-tRNA(Gln) amidotransferase subunit A